MGKIHTHYDNLKVARLAPQEVIRAAYKALSQKYHPDKNPGDEKAARIMAILNSAYGILSDPQRRREHDEWIAAEEWEIAWLESTQQEEGKQSRPKGQAAPPPPSWAQDVPSPKGGPRRRGWSTWRNWRWWLSVSACLLLGWLGALLMQDHPPAVPVALASAWNGLAREGVKSGDADNSSPLAPKTEAVVIDSWAVSRPSALEPLQTKPPEIKVLAVSQLSLSNSQVACDGAAPAQMLVAPNGEPWPRQSAYVDGFPVSNKGSELELMLDNSANAAPVFVKLYDLERRSNVRYLYILAHDKLKIEQLSAGKYEVRYQSLAPDADGCATRPVSGTANPPPVLPALQEGAQNPVVSSI